MYYGRGKKGGFSGDLSTSLKILNMFGYGETNVTSQQVCKWLNVSGNTASNRLNEMFHKAWLKRKRDPNPDVRNGYAYNLRKGGIKMLAWMEENDVPRPCRYSEKYLRGIAFKNNIRLNSFKF